MEKQLLCEIEKLRSRLNKEGDSNTLTSGRILELSRELDSLILVYLRLTSGTLEKDRCNKEDFN